MTGPNKSVSYLDSHVHFWDLERGDYHWLKPENPVLYRNYLSSDYFENEAAAALNRLIAVQAAHTTAETEYLLELAENDCRIAGVVGWLDPFADSFEEDYLLFRTYPRFVGIRLDHTVFNRCAELIPDRLLSNLQRLEQDQFAVDLLFGPDQMQAVVRCLRLVPNLKAVLNHMGAPPISTGHLQPWSSHIDELARCPNVYCKWSGMITPAGGVNPQLLLAFIRHTAERFGPDRIIFGSDWPVSLQAGSLADVLQLFEQLLPPEWMPSQHAAIRRTNAERFYLGIEE
ncbi:amidohydrolase family protein [Paenibacillus silvisoli]|uniref:amidohydrolase family protein n=1 Tax=Paenibacillus silvisoli TaxID=3110539 RepID=UPI002804F975|nr:amidohydrolase family protein [Paenibacillus silvisoli]